MKKSSPPSLSTPSTKKAPGRPSSLTKAEERRYVTLRSWNFSQREAGALARNLPRGRKGGRPSLGASTCQRLDDLHGPFAETPTLPPGHTADSLRRLSERALVALADARGDVNNRKYLEVAGLRPVVKRTRRAKTLLAVQDVQPTEVVRCAALPEESITRRAWDRAQFCHAAFLWIPTRTQADQLRFVREWCSGSRPVELDADARSHLTPWERIAATWDGEFISDADRATLLLPFRDEGHPKITPASREAILAARDAMHSAAPLSIRADALLQRFASQPFDPEEWDQELPEAPAEMSGREAAAIRAKIRAEREATKRVMRWAGDDTGEWPVGPFDVDYG